MVMYAVLFLLLASCALLCVETIWRGSFSEAVMWASRATNVAALCIGAIAALEALLYAASGRMLLSVGLVNFILTGISLVQHYKLELRGEDFLLSDIMLLSEAASVVEKFSVTLPWYVVLPCAIMVLLTLCGWGIRLKGRMKKRLAAACLSGALFAVCCVGVMNLADWSTSVRDYYNLNGVIAGLVWSRPRAIDEPEKYSRAAIEEIVGQYEMEDTADVLPDIFFIMSESLYDLARLPALNLSEDSMPYFRSLQESGWGGQICVVPYGGGTVNTEYAVLTGYLPDAKMVAPYLNRNMMPEDMLCIPQMLKGYGYYTLAMHPNVGSMYNRKNAYPNMGFDETVFSENMPEVDDRIGGFPSDDYLYREIIRQYENRPKDKPWFSFTVTFQNHGGYGYGYDRYGIEATDQAGEPIDHASTYANAVKASDEALKMLVSYLNKQERPVVLVIFGDHAPALESLGYQRSAELGDEYLVHTTPALVYSNYGIEMRQTQGSTMSVYRLGASVMDAIGLHADRYYNYLADPKRDNVHTLGGVLVGNDGMWIDEQKYMQAADELELLYYDRVAGKEYSGKEGSGE